MPELIRQLRWLFVFRLLTLSVAVFVLPRMVAFARQDLPVVAGLVLGLIVLWTVPFWGAWARQERVLGLLGLVEALMVGYLVDAYGRLESPFALLFLPVFAQAAAMLPPVGYALVAATGVTAYVLAILPDLEPRFFPAWTPLLAAGMLLLVAWLGVLGEAFRRERLRLERTERRFHRFRALVERLPSVGKDAQGWRNFLRQVERGGGFLDGALVYWEGPRARVIATDRQASWEGLVRRHHAIFRHRLLEARQPEIFVETRPGYPARSIVCWPITTEPPSPAEHPQGEPAVGALCMLAEGTISVGEAERRLRHWVPLAALGLAAARPGLIPEPAPVDWQVLINVTLHRLHERLKPYLVMVHVDPGRVTADAVMLADAIARAIEDALSRVPPQSQVHVEIRRVEGGWRFRVRAEGPIHPPATSHAGELLKAQQVVAAHGGEWRASASRIGYEVGFLLPDRPQPGDSGLTSEGSVG